MIKRRLTRGLMVVLGGALLVVSASQAMADGRMERLQSRLNLTDDQAKAIQEIFTRNGQTQRQIHQSLRQAQTDLSQLVLNGAEPGVVQQKTAEVQGLMAQGLQVRIQQLQEIAPILTPEQRAKFAQLQQEGPPMRRGGPHRHSS